MMTKVLPALSNGCSARRDSWSKRILQRRLTSHRRRSRRRTACCSTFNSAGCPASICNDALTNSVPVCRSFLSLRMTHRRFASRLGKPVAQSTSSNPSPANRSSKPSSRPSAPMPKTNQNKAKGNPHAGQSEESATRVVREVAAWLLAPNSLFHGMNLPSVNSL